MKRFNLNIATVNQPQDQDPGYKTNCVFMIS